MRTILIATSVEKRIRRHLTEIAGRCSVIVVTNTHDLERVLGQKPPLDAVIADSYLDEPKNPIYPYLKALRKNKFTGPIVIRLLRETEDVDALKALATGIEEKDSRSAEQVFAALHAYDKKQLGEPLHALLLYAQTHTEEEVALVVGQIDPWQFHNHTAALSFNGLVRNHYPVAGRRIYAALTPNSKRGYEDTQQIVKLFGA